MAFKDLREFLTRLEAAGELMRIKEEVDWKYEISGWTRRCYDMTPRGPALLFERIRNYGPQHRVLTNAVGTYPRLAIALGLPAETSPGDLIKIFKERMETLIPPRIVKTGPVQENIMAGKEVNLYKFPTPWWTPRDGGRYIGTWVANVSKNPKTGVVNLGSYRMQLVDKNHTCVGFRPDTHIGLHYMLREQRDEPLEMAAVVGAEESVMLAAITGVPEPVDEYAVAGALRGEAVELVKCQTVDLYVPATAEIVIEGKILPHKRVPEGPYGEHTGYHGGGVRMRPLFEVTAVTYRNDPILRGVLLGKPMDEAHLANSIITSAAGLANFEKGGPAGVTAIYCTPQGDSCLTAVIQMRPYYVGHSRDVGRFWLSTTRDTKYVVIVDEDIDPFDLSQVWWAIATRTRASRDLEVHPFGRISRSDPSAPREGEYTDHLIIDATKKLDYPYIKAYGGHWAPVCLPPKKVMELVDLKWRKIFGGEPIDKKEIDKLFQEIEALEQDWRKWREEAYALTADEQEKEIARSYPKVAREE